MYKRIEFRHEREIRLIYTGKSSRVHTFPINPNNLFEEIVFDPRLDGELYKAYEAAVIGKGFKNRIAQSVLYRPPPNLLIRV